MDRRTFLGSLGVLAVSLPASAQQAGTVYRIGVLITAAPQEAPHLSKALDDGLRDLGYVEGRSIVVERRSAGGRQEQLPALAQELVRLNVAVIVAGSNPVIASVKQKTATIPVVMPVDGNREFAQVGGPVSCGPNIAHQWRRAAVFVDKILKGARPGDLPIEQPTKFELIVNLETRRASASSSRHRSCGGGPGHRVASPAPRDSQLLPPAVSVSRH